MAKSRTVTFPPVTARPLTEAPAPDPSISISGPRGLVSDPQLAAWVAPSMTVPEAVMVGRALAAAERLRKAKLKPMVINMSTIKPIDEKMILKAAKKCGAIVSAEEHSIIGGLGTAIAEVLTANYPVPQEFVGIPDVFGESGESEELMDGYGLKIDTIVKKAKRAVSRKKK